MQYFERYVSNTTAGSGNQHFFLSDKQPHTGRLFYRMTTGGTYKYSFLFSNIIDSTYADGSVSYKNLICDEWEIISARAGICKKENKQALDEAIEGRTEPPKADGWKQIFFDKREEKIVNPGEFFCSDEMELSFEKGDYLCLEMTFRGEMIPYHEESRIPVFIKENGSWVYCKKMPFAGMVGISRDVRARIGFLGDSITQGIGADYNSYEHWNARLADMLGDAYSYWNLGLGFGRASDAASKGAWLYKAKQNDVVVVCYGVNDILQGASKEQLKQDLAAIVKELKASKKAVLLQTIPPFEYEGEYRQIWFEVNEYIKKELVKSADVVFDVVPVLQEKDTPWHAKYGPHPDGQGCLLWAEALYPVLKELLEK